MPLPSTTIDIAFETFLQELPQDYWDLAYEFKAFCRARKIKTPAELMRVVMSYCGLDQVLREAAGTFTLLNESISDTAIHKRLKGCVPWVKAVLERLIGAGAQALIEGRLRWVVVDATSVQGPGARGTGARVHVAIDLVRLHLIAVTVTDQHQGESLDQYPLQEGDVVVMDRGYHSPREFVHWGAQGVCFVARYHWHNMNVYTAKQQKYDSVARVKTASSDQWCEPVRIRYQGEYLEAWLHAQRLPGEQAALARARVRKAAQKKGRTVSADALLMAEWVMVLTTVPPELLPTETITALYRLRWQVELVIKRLKSLLDLDRLRAREDSLLAELYLHGKLLYAWVVEQRARRRCGVDWMRTDCPRQATWWRVWKVIHQELGMLIRDVAHWRFERWAQCLAVMQERPRKRQLQTLPSRVKQLLVICQACGLSHYAPMAA